MSSLSSASSAATAAILFLTVFTLMTTADETFVRGGRRISPRLQIHRRTRAVVKYEYAAVIDAGSSGSRVRVYRWPDRSGDRVETADMELMRPQLKMTPGLSKVAENLTVVRHHIKSLIVNASNHVPKALHRATPIYFMATAGMRQLTEVRMNDVVQYIDSLMQDKSFNPFHYASSSNSRILSGEEEGVFAWITVNYLLGTFNENGNKDVQTTGILEMGGASTQIAFLPTGNVLADQFPVRIGRKRYPLYVHSYLDYGQDNLIRWLKERLYEDYKKQSSSEPVAPLTNPCMHSGDTQFQKIRGVNVTFTGNGDVKTCKDLLERLVFKAEEWQCHPKPCAIGSFYQPTLPSDMTFYAVGAFIHSLTAINAINDSGVYVPSHGIEKAEEYCRKPYSEIATGGKDEYVRHNCVRGLYTAILFTRGYGFSEDTDRIIVSDKLNEQSLDWTLGAVLYENVLQTCRISGDDMMPMMGSGSTSGHMYDGFVLFLLTVAAAAAALSVK